MNREVDKKGTGYPSIDKPWMKYYETLYLDFPKGTMFDYLEKSAKDKSKSIALNYFGKDINFAWMFAEIDRIAGRLAFEGIKKGDVVMLLSLNTPEAICLFYAINKIGAIACNEYVSQSAELLNETITKIRPKKIFVLDVFAKGIEKTLKQNKEKVIILRTINSMPVPLKLVVGRKIVIDEEYTKYDSWIKGKRIEKYDVSHDENAPAMMLSTSGTTGIPKKVVHSSFAINAVVYQYQNSGIVFQAGKKCISPAPIFLAFGVTLGMHLPLCTGICTVIVLNPQNEKVVDAYRKHKPEYFLGGVHMVREMVANKKMQKMDCSFIKVFAIGGESFSKEENMEVNAFFKSRGAVVPMITGYGMTEMGATAVTEMNEVVRSGTVGIPQIAVNAKVVDVKSGTELQYGEFGEIMLTAPSVFLEYYDNEEESKKTIETDENGVRWVHTGDLGKIDCDGFVYVSGRIKRIYLRQLHDGNIYKVFPDYIENMVSALTCVKTCAAICVENDVEISVPVVFAVLNHNETGIEDTMSRIIVEQSAEYNRPFKYIFLDKMPILPNGKTDYQELERLFYKKSS